MHGKQKEILLFDMDGVLLQAGGYHRALQDTVALIAKALGFQNLSLDQEDIDLFEAVGVTSEWDSSAICTALLMVRIWEQHPDWQLPQNPVACTPPVHRLSPPDFQPFYHRLSQAPGPEASPLDRAERLLLQNGKGHTAEQVRCLQGLLRKARGIQGSLTHRLFQEMVLGSQVFEEAYRLTPFLLVDSYLVRYDRPLLDPARLGVLHSWLKEAEHSAAIFTNRPSRSVDGFFSTPEAELGAHAAGVGSLPVVGLGPLAWLASKNSLDKEAYIKPSPVHVLAAIWLAVQGVDDPAEKSAGRIPRALDAALGVLESRVDPSWSGLANARVYVFEDAVRGLQSARAAHELLERLGFPLQVTLCGISDRFLKQQALRNFGAQVFPSLSDALQNFGIIPFEKKPSL